MNTDDVSTWATQTLLPALAAAVTWAGTRFGRLLERKRRAARVANAIVRLDHVVLAVVRELEQRAVGVLRQVTRDAGLGDTVKTMLRRAALAKTKHLLGDRELANLAKALGAKAPLIDDFIVTRIEAAVHGLAHERRLKQLHATSWLAPTKATKRN